MLEALLSGSPQYVPPSGPATYNGIATAANLVKGTDVAAALGLAVGATVTSQATTSEWLAFISHEGKAVYIATARFQYGLSWNHINGKGGVDGSKTILAGGKLCKIRLLSSAEWDAYMYSVSASRPATYTGEKLAELGDAALGLTFGFGSATICSDLINSNCTMRGGGAVQTKTTVSYISVTNGYGWRPVLESVDPV